MRIWVDLVDCRLTLAKFQKKKPRGKHTVYEGVVADRETVEVDAGPKDEIFLVMADFPENFKLDEGKSIKSELSDWIVTTEPDMFVDSDENPVTLHKISFNKWMEI